MKFLYIITFCLILIINYSGINAQALEKEFSNYYLSRGPEEFAKFVDSKLLSGERRDLVNFSAGMVAAGNKNWDLVLKYMPDLMIGTSLTNTLKSWVYFYLGNAFFAKRDYEGSKTLLDESLKLKIRNTVRLSIYYKSIFGFTRTEANYDTLYSNWAKIIFVGNYHKTVKDSLLAVTDSSLKRLSDNFGLRLNTNAEIFVWENDSLAESCDLKALSFTMPEFNIIHMRSGDDLRSLIAGLYSETHLEFHTKNLFITNGLQTLCLEILSGDIRESDTLYSFKSNMTSGDIYAIWEKPRFSVLSPDEIKTAGELVKRLYLKDRQNFQGIFKNNSLKNSRNIFDGFIDNIINDIAAKAR
ncbi:MAG: hypothetical protein K9I71_04265 [Ignavibacteriales bacterium]|nr:hypothetical protein [Ignavibacteriales bacterium]MCF8315312.1 hypothetical protein [Ignavibacteriales bacterium]MCF8436796.1 hypothetical protein [Ignavibacteriales bacterium]